MCRSLDSSKWTLACNIVNTPEKVCEAFSLELGSVHYFDWICDQCCLCYANNEHLETWLNNVCQSEDPLTAERSSLLVRTLATLRKNGTVFTKEVRSDFKAIVYNLEVDTSHHPRLCNTLTKYLSNLTKDHFRVYVPPDGNDSLGNVMYDESKFSLHSIAYIHI